MLDVDLRLHDPTFLQADEIDETFALMRETGEPVPHYDRQGNRYWAVSRYSDLQQVSRDTETFSTLHGLTLDTYSYHRRDRAADRMLEMSSPAIHDPLKEALAHLYRRNSLHAELRSLEAAASERWAAAMASRQFDLMRDVADPLTASVIFGLMGFPKVDWGELFTLSRHSQERTYEPSFPKASYGTEANAATVELLRYIKRFISRGEFVNGAHLAQLTEISVAGRVLTSEEALLNCLNILQGGNATTSHAAAGGVLSLIKDPAAAELIISRPELLNSAVEEVLRWTTPALHFCRHVESDAKIGSITIPAGEAVSIWLISANRDADVFDDPYRFDVARKANRHFAFLGGPQRCLGNHLARLELRVLLSAIIPHLADVFLDGAPRRVFSNFINGYESIPMRTLDSA